MSEHKVTVFVTVYNIEKHLERFFACLSAQTYEDYEALMIDDGSSDNSLAVCRKYAQADDRIRVIASQHVGISAARELALRNIRTPYAASLDGDDYFDKDYLRHLMDAGEKTGADLVLSNVILVYEDGTEKNRFVPRSEGFYTEEELPQLLPELLSEERLNYLYAKLYKTALLQQVHIEPNVMQGSDTMINFRYLKYVRSIAQTADYDYYYVQYRKRSVTSYAGADYFMRLYRINRFLLDFTEENGMQTEDMLRVIDCRILHVGANTLKRIAKSPDSMKNKYKRAAEVVNSVEYLQSYRRIVEKGDRERFRERYRYEPIEPGTEKAFIDHNVKVLSDMKKDERLERLRGKCPESVFKLWHGLRKLTGTARKN